VRTVRRTAGSLFQGTDGDVIRELHADVHEHPRRKERDLAETRGPRDLKDRKRISA